MFILQTLREFVDNPMGKGSNAIPSRQLIKDDLNRRFDLMLGEKKKVVKFDVYRDKDEYYFHFTIPSEGTDRRNTYDVVLHFFGENGNDIKGDKNLNRYAVRFFSNSPSFTYTYAYAFNLHGLLVEGLENKFRPVVLKNLPITRNPGEIISYEKTIYFASIYLLKNSRYLNKSVLNLMAKPFRERDFVNKIRNTDQIELEIAKETKRIKHEQKKEKAVQERKEKPETEGLNRRKDSKITGDMKVRNSNHRITAKSKITPRKSSNTKIKPK